MDYYSQLLEKHRNRGILIDTNILLLLFIGDFKKDLITNFKRTKAYTINDFIILRKILSKFSIIYTTPHILTETNNLIKNSIVYPDFEIFATQLQIYNQNKLLNENWVVSENLDYSTISKFGLTDAAIFDLAKSKHLVLTDDLPLYYYLSNKGIDVINFNHLRLLNI